MEEVHLLVNSKIHRKTDCPDSKKVSSSKENPLKNSKKIRLQKQCNVSIVIKANLKSRLVRQGDTIVQIGEGAVQAEF